VSDAAYSEGDRCRQCLRWFWDKDGRWHRWIPTRILAVAEFAREVTCPRCVTRAVRELRRDLARV
jgi:hypothetical protein